MARDLNLMKQDLENIVFAISDRFSESKVTPPIIYKFYKGDNFLFKIRGEAYNEIKSIILQITREIPNLKIVRRLSGIDKIDEALKSNNALEYEFLLKGEHDWNLEISAGCLSWRDYPLIYILKRGDYEKAKEQQNKKINEILKSILPKPAFHYDYDDYNCKSRWEIPYENRLVINISPRAKAVN